MGSAQARVRLRVVPGARRAEIVGRHGEAWKLRVRAAPEGGAANKDVVSLLADTLEIPARDVRVVSGHGRREKMVELAGIDARDVERRLSSAVERDQR